MVPIGASVADHVESRGWPLIEQYNDNPRVPPPPTYRFSSGHPQSSGTATSTHFDSASAFHRTPAATLPHQSELHGGSVAMPQSVQMQVRGRGGRHSPPDMASPLLGIDQVHGCPQWLAAQRGGSYPGSQPACRGLENGSSGTPLGQRWSSALARACWHTLGPAPSHCAARAVDPPHTPRGAGCTHG